MRTFLLILMAVALIASATRAVAVDTYAPGDTVRVAVSRADTFYNGTNAVSSEKLKVYRWLELSLDYRGDFVRVMTPDDSGTVGFYWISCVCDSGDYIASWDGTIQGRTPDAAYSFKIVAASTVPDSVTRALARLDSLERRMGVPDRTVADEVDDLYSQLLAGSGPYTVTLRYLDTSDSSAIPGVNVRIKDEDQVATLALLTTNQSGVATTALAADTAQVISSKVGAYTFTVPQEIVNTVSGLTDTIWGTPFDPGTPDSTDVTRIYAWLRALDGSNAEGVILRFSVLPGTGEDLGSPASSPTLIVTRQAVACTTNANGYFYKDLICSDQLLPEGGSAGTVRYLVEVSKPVRIGPKFIAESDTIYVPCTLQKYLYWDAALRP